MGLDIYLYRYNDFNKTQEVEQKYRDYSKEVWDGNDDGEKYDKLSEAQKDEYRAKESAFAKSLGLDRWGYDVTNKECIEINSEKYPDHYFKVGYFRSSYNEGGIQRILRNLGLPDLNDVFNRKNESYEFQPNWESALFNVKSLIEKFKEKGNYRVHHVASNMFNSEPSKIRTEKDALDVFLNEVEKHKDDKEKYNYSNSTGEFSFSEPMKVLAMIPGSYKIFHDRECIYVITEGENEWYINALEIVQETIEYVLSKENKDQYYLHWSG